MKKEYILSIILSICVLIVGYSCAGPKATTSPTPTITPTASQTQTPAQPPSPTTPATTPGVAYDTEILVEGLVFPECPRWHDGKLWFSDMSANRVMTVDLEGNTEVIVEVPGGPGGLGWLPDGRLLVVSRTDKKLLRFDATGLTEVADLTALAGGDLNDMVVDALGRAYIGNKGLGTIDPFFIRPAEIIMVTPEGDMSIVATDMIYPNGSVITPDGRTLIVAETFGSCLTAFDIEPDGSLTGRRVWASLGGSRLPDGMCLDAQGAIWFANPASKEVVRVGEGSQVTDRIVPSTAAYACALGGPDGRTLFICTKSVGGFIETVIVDVPATAPPVAPTETT
jgi:sugar lactone lactonase YvrE